MTFKKMYEIAEGGESCVFVFPDNDAARKYVDFVASHRPIRHCEAEVYDCNSTQMHYMLGDCVGTSVIGYQNHHRPPKGNWYYFKKKGATVL